MKLVNILSIYLNFATSKKILSQSSTTTNSYILYQNYNFYPLPPPISPNSKLYSILGDMSLFINVILKNGFCARTTSVGGKNLPRGHTPLIAQKVKWRSQVQDNYRNTEKKKRKKSLTRLNYVCIKFKLKTFGGRSKRFHILRNQKRIVFMMGKLYMHWNIGNHVVRSAIEISQLFIIYFVNFVRFEVEWKFLQNILCKK